MIAVTSKVYNEGCEGVVVFGSPLGLFRTNYETRSGPAGSELSFLHCQLFPVGPAGIAVKNGVKHSRAH
ncbi:hypothetical protein SLA2020_284000 [Shorea laevis]